jgi:hypothetical protein
MKRPLVLASVNATAAIVAALWIAGSYIDEGDSTCGSVLRPATPCGNVLPLRAFWALGIVGLGLGALGVSVRGQKVALRMVLASLLVTVMSLLVNELIRSGGAL